jgi:hypothetical protein
MREFAPDYQRDENGLVLFPRDTGLRRQLFPYTDPAEHVAKANMLAVQEIVLYVSEKGETILDPFAGTGTIMVACTHWRKVIMIELLDTFCQTIELNTIGVRQTFPDIDELTTLIPGDAASILPITDFCDHMIFCLHPDTKILTYDLQWKRLGNLKAGDKLIGVDEYARFGCKNRKIRYSEILSLIPTRLDSYKIIISDGRIIVASSKHSWLTARNHSLQWTETNKLKVGDKIKQLTSRTMRLLLKFNLDGVGLPMVDSLAEIISIEHIGVAESVGIETSTKTLIAEGLVSHNSPPYPMGLKKKGEMDKTSKDLGYTNAAEYSDDMRNFTNLNAFMYHQKIEQFYKKCFLSIRKGGTMTIIIKDKMEKGKRQMQGDRTIRDCERLGFELVARNKWLAKGGGYSAINRAAGLETVDDEDLITFRRV